MAITCTVHTILDLIENGSFLLSFGGSSHYFPFRFDSARRKGS